jgi:predicted ArsR family transcriptional regulator
MPDRRPYRKMDESTLIVLDELAKRPSSAREVEYGTDLSPWTIRTVMRLLAHDDLVRPTEAKHRFGNTGRWATVWRITGKGQAAAKRLRKVTQ